MRLFHMIVPSALCLLATVTRGQELPLPELKATIQLPSVRGRIDHMAVDLKEHLVYVCALGNNTVEVASLDAAKWIRSLRGFTEPQGIILDTELNRLFITNGGEGSCTILDAASLKVLGKISDLPDADNVRFDKSAKLVCVAYGSGGLAAIDAQAMQTKFSVSLPEHPESFQLETGGQRAYVNVPGAGKIVVIDRATRSVVDSWSVHGAAANFPMALIEKHRRLIVGFRNPACIQVLATESGKMVQSVPIGEDVDDIFFDAKRNRVYASCGGGEIDVFAVDSTGALTLQGKIPTRAGARTSLLVPELNTLIVAAPLHGDKPAELRVYSVGR